jgi:alkanesulfonate monooxygenase SsuD/methylene tetrahydromethanopterin reductase-like flavin-dependent oxidoreductase (luciferase family)
LNPKDIFSMRLGIVTIPRTPLPGPELKRNVIAIAQKVEELGFAGIWVTDAFARGRATLDPLVLLGLVAGHTDTIELGTCVVQVPLRHPVEHAQRVQTLNLLSGGRLRFGVGTGSTKADFDAVQVDYDARFKTLPAYLEVMQRTWRGEPVYGPALTPWKGTEGGPPVLLGAWRSERWINLCAKSLQGWISSGIHSKWEDLELGVKMYRAAGGTRAIIANVFTDLRPNPVTPPFSHGVQFSLLCSPDEARTRLKRLEDLGFDDALLVVPDDDLNQLETIRGLI